MKKRGELNTTTIVVTLLVLVAIVAIANATITGNVGIQSNNVQTNSINITTCGTISTTSTLTSNLSTTGNCLTINTSNAEINCANYKITGNAAGLGININGFSNVTLKNCRITNFTTNIDLRASPNTKIINADLSSGVTNLFINSSNNVSVINSSINKSGIFTGGGIRATNSPGFILQNSVISNSSSSNSVVYMTNISNSKFISNTILNTDTALDIRYSDSILIHSNTFKSQKTDVLLLLFDNFLNISNNTFLSQAGTLSINLFSGRAAWITNNNATNINKSVFELTSFNDSIISGNKINLFTQTISTADPAISLDAGSFNNTIKNNIIQSGNSGISISGSSANKIINNTIKDIKKTDAAGIRIQTASNNLIENNTLNNIQPLGIILINNSNNNIVKNNILTNLTASIAISGGGIFLSSAGIASLQGNNNNNTIKDNIINQTNYGIGQATVGGVFPGNSNNNKFISNTIINSSIAGIYFGPLFGTFPINSTNITILNNKIHSTGTGIHLSDLTNINLSNNSLTGNILGLLTSDINNLFISNQNFISASFQNTSVGQLNYSKPINFTTEKKLNDVLKISNGTVFANSTAIPSFNQSAQIILTGLTPLNRSLAVSFDDTTFQKCNAPQCINLTPLNGTTIKFNVSSFTTYMADADNDSDGFANIADNCPVDLNPDQTNTDTDEFGDVCDNCILINNPNQEDNDPIDAVSYWRLDETSSPTAKDSKNNNDGLITEATFITGRVNTGLKFNGVNTTVNISDNQNLNFTTVFSIELWFNQSSITGSTQMILRKPAQGPPGPKFALFIDTADIINFKASIGGTSNTEKSNFSTQKNTWYHTVGTYNGSIMKLYINGVLINETPVSGTSASSNKQLTLGYNDAFGQYFNGTLDEIAVYSRALTETEIQDHYNQGLQGNGYRSQDGIGDGCVIGTLNNTNFITLNTSISPTGIINITDNGNTILEFNWTKAETLNFSNISIFKENSGATEGSLLVKGINLTGTNQTKTVYVNKISGSNQVCVKDAKITNITEINLACTGESETLLTCPETKGNYTCTITGSKYVITGLKYSGVIENPIVVSTTTPSNERRGHGGSTYTCIREWDCTKWNPCKNNIQTRTCKDINNCTKTKTIRTQTFPVNIVGPEKPEITQKCEGTPTTCNDKIQNQLEEGIDCGGPCPACAVFEKPKETKKEFKFEMFMKSISLITKSFIVKLIQVIGNTIGQIIKGTLNALITSANYVIEAIKALFTALILIPIQGITNAILKALVSPIANLSPESEITIGAISGILSILGLTLTFIASLMFYFKLKR